MTDSSYSGHVIVTFRFYNAAVIRKITRKIEFRTEADGNTIGIFATLAFYEEQQRCRFDAGQTAEEEINGSMKFIYSGIYVDKCDTEVDKGDVFNYAAHRLFFIIRSIRTFFENVLLNIRYNGGNEQT
ncbi:MAG: hypothetical protein K6G90_02330 [Clostridia bacterium]|nr:hypothetical protein [Clostridia bacterium]